jgi:hypothetical protein
MISSDTKWFDQTGSFVRCKNMVARMDEPAVYQIRIHGNLAKTWSDRLSGMAISTEPGLESQLETILVGELADQAALMGVLNALYNLGFTLIYVYRDNQNSYRRTK